MKAGEHGPDELYDKFVVFKNKHPMKELTNTGEFIFVLRPETDDQAAIHALLMYADKCEATYPNLAWDIRKKVSLIQNVER